MSVDLGGLPKLPDPDTIIADAGLIAASGARAAVHGTSLVTTWNGVQAVYAAPEQSLVYEAMRPVTDFTEASIVTLSAGKNVVFEGGFGVGFAFLGTAVGTALGAAGAGALGFAVGSVFPVVGNAIGGATGVATGAIAGGAIGSTVLGAAGEGLGSYLQDRTEGKNHEEAFEAALAEFFDQVW